MDEQALRRDVLLMFEFAHDRQDWVHPLRDSLAGVTAEEAYERPGPDAMGIWDIVLHVAAWNENCVERIQSGEHRHPAEGAWPARPAAPEQAAWEEAKERLWRSLAGLRAEVEAATSSGLVNCSIGNGEMNWSPLAEILGRYVHNAYHAGQIAKMREMRPAQGGAA